MKTQEYVKNWKSAFYDNFFNAREKFYNSDLNKKV